MTAVTSQRRDLDLPAAFGDKPCRSTLLSRATNICDHFIYRCWIKCRESYDRGVYAVHPGPPRCWTPAVTGRNPGVAMLVESLPTPNSERVTP